MATATIFQDALRSVGQDRAAAERLREARLNELYEKEPRLRELDRAITENGLGAAKLMLSDASARAEAARRMKETNAALNAEKAGIYARLGVALDWPDSAYGCAACKDTGFVGAGRCACLNRRLIERYVDVSRLGRVLEKENFETFDMTYYSDEPDAQSGVSPRQNMRKNWTVCNGFVKRFGESFENLLLYGSTGLGKTFLCNCIAKDLLERGKSVVYTPAPQLFKAVEDYRFNRKEGDGRALFLEMVNDCDLLVLDDLGTEVSTSVTVSELFGILNERLLADKPVVISTNLAPNDLEAAYGDRVVSRLFGNYTLLRFFGSDIRLRKKYGM